MTRSWLLTGLTGGNPLAFLAALGTLKTATLVWPHSHCRMAWKRSNGNWRPILTVDVEDSVDLIAALARELKREPMHQAFAFSNNLTIGLDDFRHQATKAQAVAFKYRRAADLLASLTKKPVLYTAAAFRHRRFADFIAAFGSEVIKEANDPKRIADTALRTMSGAGHQDFLGTMQQLVTDTEPEHLRKALLDPWRYDDPVEKHTMRWDPHDDVRRALRWSEPSGDPARKVQGSVWGANRLAVEGITLLPTAPVGNRLETTGFIRRKNIGIFWTWPIWEREVGVDVVRSLLALQELQAEFPDRFKLDAMGIKEIYRCERITQGRFRNFTMGVPV